MGIEKSPGHERYVWKRNEVRALPQQTFEQRRERHEQAKMLRMEAMLENAQCAQIFTESLQDNPEITAEALKEKAKSMEMIAHPEAVEKFIDKALQIRKQVWRARRHLNMLSRAQGYSAAQELFRWSLINQGALDWHPRGAIRLDGSYPLALALYVENQADFERIDTRKNIDGFFSLSKRVETDSSELEFPLIVVNGAPVPFAVDDAKKKRTEGIEHHEKGHAENDLFVKSLGVKSRRVVWEKPPLSQVVVEKLSIAARANLQQAKASLEWRRIIDYALGRAKDELLAEYKVGRRPSEYSRHLLAQGGVYDYFKDALRIDPKSELYKELWQDYRWTLQGENMAMQDVVRSYQSFQLEKRTELFRWVLAQIPLQQWQRQLEGTLFSEEAEGLREAKAVIEGVKKSTGGNDEARQRICNDFEEALRREQLKPLLPVIRSFKETLRRLEDRRQIEVWEELERDSKKLIVEAQEKRMRPAAESILRGKFKSLCQKNYLTFSESFIDSFLEAEGWITKEEELRRRQERFRGGYQEKVL